MKFISNADGHLLITMCVARSKCSVAQSLNQLVEHSNHVRLVELLVRERDRDAWGQRTAQMLNSLPAADKANGCLQVFESAAANFASQVVPDTSALTRFVNNDQAASLADSIRNLADRQRVDRAKINQLDRRGRVRRAELLRKILNQAGWRVREELNSANCPRQHVGQDLYVRVV